MNTPYLEINENSAKLRSNATAYHKYLFEHCTLGRHTVSREHFDSMVHPLLKAHSNETPEETMYLKLIDGARPRTHPANASSDYHRYLFEHCTNGWKVINQDWFVEVVGPMLRGHGITEFKIA